MYVETIIVGAGPIGIEIAANLKILGLDYLHFEAGVLGQTIFSWPRNTPFFSSPERVAIAGVPLHSVHQSMLTGEDYIAYLRIVVEHYDLNIHFGHRVLSAQRGGNGQPRFLLKVEYKGLEVRYSADRLILANGNMHAPRRINVSGEDMSHVDHYHSDVHRYFRQKVVIVGGRNSAVEAAIRSWRAGATVTLLQRKEALEKRRLNSRYYLEISILIDKGKISFLPGYELDEITRHTIKYHHSKLYQKNVHDQNARQIFERDADFVLLCIGFDKDMSLLYDLGVKLDEKMKPILHSKTMETSVSGLFCAGTAAGGAILSYKIFIGTSHVHVERIVKAISTKQAIVSDYHSRRYSFSVTDIEPIEGDLK